MQLRVLKKEYKKGSDTLRKAAGGSDKGRGKVAGFIGGVVGGVAGIAGAHSIISKNLGLQELQQPQKGENTNLDINTNINILGTHRLDIQSGSARLPIIYRLQHQPANN